MNVTLVRKYLRQFIKDSAKQKFRLDETIRKYQENENTLKENIIDLKDLIADMEANHKDPAQIDILKQNQQHKEDMRNDMLSIIESLKVAKEELVKNIQSQLSELTEIEINIGGFIPHIVTTDHQTKFDEEKNIISFEEKGHAEIHISTYLESWKDSSQLRILTE
jgi:desulfoferrodoxin (superoxide reductase-like protein)